MKLPQLTKWNHITALLTHEKQITPQAHGKYCISTPFLVSFFQVQPAELSEKSAQI